MRSPRRDNHFCKGLSILKQNLNILKLNFINFLNYFSAGVDPGVDFLALL